MGGKRLLGLPGRGNFAFDIFKRIASVSMEIGVSECPALFDLDEVVVNKERATYMLPELVVIRVFYFVEVVLVKLPNETGKVGMLEHSRQDRLGELVHILLAHIVSFSGRKRHSETELLTFTTKQSPCGPQLTTDWNAGSSSILDGNQ